MGIFGRGINKKTATPGGQWSAVGKHRVKIRACRERNGFKGESTIVEYDVLKSNNPEVLIGSTRSWVQNYSSSPQFRDVKEGNLADFIRVGLATMAAKEGESVEVDEVEFDDSDLEAIFLEEQLFSGLELDLEVFKVETGKKTEFHKHVWSMPEELAEAAA